MFNKQFSSKAKNIIISITLILACSIPKTSFEVKTTLQIGVDKIHLETLLRGRNITRFKDTSTEVVTIPDDLKKTVKYADMQLNISGLKDKTITLITEWPITQESLAVIDINNNENLNDDEIRNWIFSDNNISLDFKTLISLEDTTYSYQIDQYKVVEYIDYAKVVDTQNNCYRLGNLIIQGKSFQFALYDNNYNGLYNDMNEDLILIDLDDNGLYGKLVGLSEPIDYHYLKDRFNINNTCYEVAHVSPEGTHIRFQKSDSTCAKRYPLTPGNPCPEFSFFDQDSIFRKLDDFHGKNVLLIFWAIWCPPCMKKMPYYKELFRKYTDKDFQIIGINLDHSTEDYKKYLLKNSVPWPDYHDGRRWENKIAKLFRLKGIPQVILLDKDGIIQFNDFDKEEFNRILNSIFDKDTTTYQQNASDSLTRIDDFGR